MRATVKTNGFGDLSVWWSSNQQAPKPLTPYEFLRAIEYIVSPPSVDKKHDSIASPAGGLRHGKDPLEVPWYWLRHVVFDPFLRMIKAKSKERNEAIQKILAKLERFTLERQERRAKILIDTRDPKIEKWKLRLEKLDLNEERLDRSEQVQHLSNIKALVEAQKRLNPSMLTIYGERTSDHESLSETRVDGTTIPYPTSSSSKRDDVKTNGFQDILSVRVSVDGRNSTHARDSRSR